MHTGRYFFSLIHCPATTLLQMRNLHFHFTGERVMSIITISTPFNIDLEFKLATFGKRALAWFIDLMVITAYDFIILQVFDFIGANLLENYLIDFLLLFLPVLAYQMTFEIFFNGQTLGKRATGIKIIDSDGQEPTWGQYVIRWVLSFGNYFIYIVPFILIRSPFSIVFIAIFYVPDAVFILATKRSQRVGDLAAGTVVIDANYKPDIEDTIYKEIEVTNYVPVFPQVMRLTDRDINGISNLIKNRRTGKEDRVYVEKVVNKIKSVLQLESEVSGYDFLEQLLYDYNYLSSKG